MSTSTKHETQIIADPDVPTITVIREFDAPVDRVFRAWTDRDLFAQWCGPRSTEMRIDKWSAQTGGCYRYAAIREGEEIAAFYGAFHEVRQDERLVQTFTWEGMPDGVSLDTYTFSDLGDGRTRVTCLTVVDSMESQRGIMSSGMDVGVNDGYEKLDEILAAQA